MAAEAPAVAPTADGDPGPLDLKGLTVGVFTDDGFISPAPSVARAVQEAAEHLRQAGCRVVEFRPPCAEEIIET